MSIERLSGGLTPADGSDPRTFPAIFNGFADEFEGKNLPAFSAVAPTDGQVPVFDAVEGVFVPGGGGAVVQIVRATSDVFESSTSTTHADSLLSVSITPQFSTSRIFINYYGQLDTRVEDGGSSNFAVVRIVDDSNNTLDGAANVPLGYLQIVSTGISNTRLFLPISALAVDEPGSTATQTYKLQFRLGSGTRADLAHQQSTGQLIATEVAS